MIQIIKDRWNALSMLQKAACIIGLPVIILLVLTKAGRLLLFKAELGKQASVEKQSDALGVQLATQQTTTTKLEGHVEELQKDKQDAVAKSKDTDSVSFYDSRYKPDGK